MSDFFFNEYKDKLCIRVNIEREICEKIPTYQNKLLHASANTGTKI